MSGKGGGDVVSTSGTLGERFALMCDRLLRKFGSTVTWTREERSETAPGRWAVTDSTDYSVRAAQVTPDEVRQLPDELTRAADMVLVLAVRNLQDAGLPSEAVEGNAVPTVADSVVWHGRRRSVLWTRTFDGPGGAAGPVPIAVFVGLGG